ncbi:hypothetical protein FACS1894218_6400 [Bacilli bacterium]|nr:hypothetical protein FACS1894218_6400 [Bacilli bacterium]
MQSLKALSDDLTNTTIPTPFGPSPSADMIIRSLKDTSRNPKLNLNQIKVTEIKSDGLNKGTALVSPINNSSVYTGTIWVFYEYNSVVPLESIIPLNSGLESFIVDGDPESTTSGQSITEEEVISRLFELMPIVSIVGLEAKNFELKFDSASLGSNPTSATLKIVGDKSANFTGETTVR